MQGLARVRYLLSASVLVLSVSCSGIAHAQTANPEPAKTADEPAETPVTQAANENEKAGIAEIVVTAERRSTKLQKTPISIAVVGSEQLESIGVGNLLNIKVAAPGVEVQANNGYAAPVIRGIGTKANGPGVETPVAVFVDGVYYATPVSTLFSFNNIAQIEILKGPQGTLFGRNTTGGLIQVTTRDPSAEWGGEVNISYANFETFRGDAYLTGGLSESVKADISVQMVTMGDGYGTNLFNGKDVYRIRRDISARSKWLFNLGPDTELRVIGDYANAKHSMAAQRVPVGAVIPPPYAPAYGGGDWDTSLSTQPIIKIKSGGISGRLDHDFGTLRFASITAYRETDFSNNFDFDFSPVNGRSVLILQHDEQFSQEVQLLSPSGNALTWTVGAYYFNASSRYDPITFFFNGVATLPGNNIKNTVFSNVKTDSISGFGQLTYEVVPGLRLTGGLRFTSEKREMPGRAFLTSATGSIRVTVPQRTLKRRDQKLTWRLAADYQFTPDVMGYVSYNRGFKSGGFNPSGLTLPPYKPEVLDAYELGLKTMFLDRRIRLNSAIFYYDYQDVQVQRIVDGANGVFNGGKARLYGLDTELVFQATPEFNIRAAYQFTHGEYKVFPGSVVATPRPGGAFFLGVGDVSGNRTVLTPKSSLSVSGTYHLKIKEDDLVITGNIYYNSGYFHEPDNVIHEPSYTLINASIRYILTNGISFGVFGNNLTNQRVSNFRGISAVGGGLGVERVSYGAPRTYGATVGFKF